jgi:hypothetical protein
MIDAIIFGIQFMLMAVGLLTVSVVIFILILLCLERR